MSALGAKMYELVRTVKARLDIPFALRLVARRIPRRRHLPDGATPFCWARCRDRRGGGGRWSRVAGSAAGAQANE